MPRQPVNRPAPDPTSSATDLHLERLLEEARAHAAALQSRIEELTDRLEQASRELESLSYSVSHDLRAPLRAIDGFSRILEEDYADRLDSEGMRVLSVIRESSAKLARLIEDVLTFSRLGRKPMAADAVDMERLAREAFQEACAGASRTPGLKVQPLPEACGDAPLIRQVWVNLLANAVKFSGPRESAVIEVGACENEAETVYSVRDNGVGFDMRYHDKLFGLFQRLHR